MLCLLLTLLRRETPDQVPGLQGTAQRKDAPGHLGSVLWRQDWGAVPSGTTRWGGADKRHRLAAYREASPGDPVLQQIQALASVEIVRGNRRKQNTHGVPSRDTALEGTHCKPTGG